MNRPGRQRSVSSLTDRDFPERLGGDRWQPAVDVVETEKAIVVWAELAGVARDDVRVSVDGEWLTIRGRRSPTRERGAERLHRMEIASGPFERRLRIGIAFEREAVAASLDDGLLKVVLPKRLPRRRRIDIQTED